MSTFATIAGMLADELQVDPQTLRPDTPLADLGVDSLAQIEFMFELEEKFGVRFGGEAPEIRIIQDIVDLVDQAVAAKAA